MPSPMTGPPRESAPTYAAVVDRCRADLARARREADVLLRMPIYPYDHFESAIRFD